MSTIKSYTNNHCIHIINTYFLAAASDKHIRLLTSLYGRLDVKSMGSTRNLRALGYSVSIAARVLLRSQGFLNLIDPIGRANSEYRNGYYTQQSNVQVRTESENLFNETNRLATMLYVSQIIAYSGQRGYRTGQASDWYQQSNSFALHPTRVLM